MKIECIVKCGRRFLWLFGGIDGKKGISWFFKVKFDYIKKF